MLRRRERYEPGSLIVRSDRELHITAPIWQNPLQRLLASYYPAIRHPKNCNTREHIVVLDSRYQRGLAYFGLYAPGLPRDKNPDVTVPRQDGDTLSPLEFAVDFGGDGEWMLYHLKQPEAPSGKSDGVLHLLDRMFPISSRQLASMIVFYMDPVPIINGGRFVAPDAPNSANQVNFYFSLTS